MEGDFSAGGTIVITGSNFTGTTSVTVNGVPVASFILDSVDQITAILAATAVGVAIVVVVETAAGSSEFTVDTSPTIRTIVPNPVCGGSAIIISGTNFTVDSSVTFTYSGQTIPLDILSRESGILEVQAPNIVPSDAVAGQVVVRTGGGSTHSALVDLTINSSPTISEPIDPATIGQSFTINGTNFGNSGAGGMVVSIGGAEAEVIDQTNTSVTVTVPYGIDTGPSEVTVTSHSGCVDGAPITVLPEPLAILTVSPNPTMLTAATSITITGTGFDATILNNIVRVGTVAATVTSVTIDPGSGADTIVATLAMETLTGSQIVSVTVNGETVTSDTPLVVGPSVLATSEAIVDQSVTIQGYGFGYPGEVTTVTLTGPTTITRTPMNESAGEIVVTAPSIAGRYIYHVTSNGVDSPDYELIVSPRVTGVDGAPFTPTRTITILGAGFDPIVANNGATVGGVHAVVTSVSLDGKSLTAVLSSNTPIGNAAVQVTVNGVPSNSDVTINILPPPTISSVDGSFFAGETIVIMGTDFIYLTDVTINGVSVTSFTVDSLNQITAVVAETLTSQEAVVQVISEVGSASFNVDLTPTIESIVPNPVCGGSVATLNGIFPASSTVTLTTLGDAYILPSISQMRTAFEVQVPNFIAGAPIVGMVTAGSSSPVQLTIHSSPIISTDTPDMATIGQSFTIEGQNLGNPSIVVTLGVNQVMATIVHQTSTSIEIIIPDIVSPGPTIVTATTGDGCSAEVPITLLDEPLSITNVSPNPITLTDSSTITITGSGFDVLVPGNNIVRVGAVAATVTSVTTDGSGGGVDTIVATLAPETLTGLQPVTVTENGETVTSDAHLVVGPSVSSISQPLISESMTIEGYGFGYSGEVVTVTFTNSDGGNTTTVSPASESKGKIVVPVPSVAGQYEFYVTSNGINSLTYSFELAPIVTDATGSPITVGGTITIFGAGFDPTVANNEATVGGVQAAVTNVSSDGTSLTAIVGNDTPVGAGAAVQVTVNGLQSNSDVAINVLPAPPTISSVDGSFFAGETIVMMGSNFVNVTSVTINGVPVTSFVVDSINQITAVVAETLSTQEATIQVATESGNTILIADLTPTITSVTPNSVCGGSTVILGGIFPASSIVMFTASSTSYILPSISQTGTAFEVEIPNFVFANPIVGTVTAGDSSPTSLTVHPAPIISADTLSTATIGRRFTVEGQNLGNPSIVVTMGDNQVVATIVDQTNTSIEIIVPRTLSPGPSSLTVTNGTGCSDSTSITLVVEPLSITNVSPNPIMLTGSSSITITGTGFNITTLSSNIVRVGTVAATVTSVTAGIDFDTIVATLAAATLTGSQAVTVTVSGTSASSPVPLVVGPSVTSTSIAAVSRPVTIQGFGFGYPGETSTVTFTGPDGGGSVTTVSPTSQSSGSITVVAPSTTGNYTYYVTSNGVNSPVYSISVGPAVTSATGSPMTPTGTITIAGAGFDPIVANNTVTIGGVAAILTGVSSNGTSLTAVIADATLVGVRALQVTTNGRPSNNNVTVTVVAPVFTSVTASPFTVFNIAGSNFTPSTKVFMDGVDMKATYVSSTQLTTSAPTAPGTYTLVLRNGDAQSVTRQYVVTPFLSLVQGSPACAGTTFILEGRGFDASTVVILSGHPTPITPTRWTSVLIQFNIPINAPAVAGTVLVRNGDGTESNSRNLTINAPVASPFTISSLSSAAGSYTIRSGQSFTVTGTNFSSVNSVTVGGQSATIQSKNSTTVVAQAPITSATSAAVHLFLPGGCKTITKVDIVP